MSRRRFLTRTLEAGGGMVALAGAGYAGHRWPGGSAPASAAASASPSAQSASGSGGVSHFASRPDLSPPTVAVTRRPDYFTGSQSASPPPYFMLSPQGYEVSGPAQKGLMILDAEGRLVWFLAHPEASTAPFDLQVQTYRGESVLTWWEGSVVNGHGEGTGYIADSTYRTIATVKAANGLQADLHELNLTPDGTALITVYRTTTADLTALGGSKTGQVLSCQVQEIDIATGRLVFSWDTLDHVAVTETRETLPKGKQTTPFDYFHMNSVAPTADGGLLVSGRNTSAVYKVGRPSGEVEWRLGGAKSDFAMGEGAEFYWQHHVRAQQGDQISVFDDGASPAQEAQSRGIVLSVDTTAKQAKLVSQYVHPARLLAANQGSMQLLSDGRAFVGWGDQPYFSEFAPDGTLLLDGRLSADNQSYRAFAADWTGRPADTPVLAVQPSTTGGVTVYASWNGATELDSWHVLAGKSASALSPAAQAYRSGFETAISVNSVGPYFAVVALDHTGKELDRSATLHHS